LEKLFQIRSEKEESSRNRRVLMEYGERFCCWGVWSRDENRLQKLDYYTFTGNAVENVCKVVDEIRDETDKINAITTCSFFPQAVLVPEEGVINPGEVAQAVYKERLSVSVSDLIRERRMVNNHLVPAGIHSAVRKNFPHSAFLHAYTPVLRKTHDTETDDLINIHFTSRSCRVMVTRNKLLQLAQIYNYSASLDVVYIILKLKEELDLQKDETRVYVSGLIDSDSALYQDLYAYLPHIEFLEPENITDNLGYPSHYFTSIANLAACVS
jgi:hypothetical protein